ncbi:MAG: GNAT family N-acetyltransferase [Candidatus Poribacteria bacterium]|nr:GNAT family N-acetyltransferase [Candidatus Poribacteria bacterium]
MNRQSHFSIAELTPDHPDWPEFASLVNDLNQEGWALNPYFEQFSRYFLAAKQNGTIVGFLMFVVWDIGPHDRDHPSIQIHGKTLKEAKILAFGVKEGYRRQGIGTALQEYTIQQAKLFDCYQVRSVSGENYPENHLLKLSMGFAVEPMERDEKCLAFVLPLKSPREK